MKCCINHHLLPQCEKGGGSSAVASDRHIKRYLNLPDFVREETKSVGGSSTSKSAFSSLLYVGAQLLCAFGLNEPFFMASGG